jgi:carbon storage regulator
MLMISRRAGERICIGDDIELVVKEIHRKHVKLAVQAGPRQLILRGELKDAILAANTAAACTPSEFRLPTPVPPRPVADVAATVPAAVAATVPAAVAATVAATVPAAVPPAGGKRAP